MAESINKLLEDTRKLREKSRRLREGLKEDLPESKQATATAKKMRSVKETQQHK